MDSYIELIAYLVKDENLPYSASLVLVTIIITGFIVFLFSKISSRKIKKQLMQEKSVSEKLQINLNALFSSQKKDFFYIADLQKKLKLSTEQLMESEKQLSDAQLSIDRLTKDIFRKQCEIEVQKQKVSEHSANKQKMAEIEQEAIQLSQDLMAVKEQLKFQEDELSRKNKEIEILEEKGQTVVVEDSGKIAALEQTMQQNNQQLARFDEQLQTILPKIKSRLQKDQPVAESDKAADGFMNKLKKVVSQLDHVDVSDPHQDSSVEDDVELDIWQRHEIVIDQLTDLLDSDSEPVVQAVQTEVAEQEKAVETKNEIEKPEQIKKTLEPETNEETVMPDLSDQVADMINEVTEKVDSFQDTLKGYYKKIVS